MEKMTDSFCVAVRCIFGLVLATAGVAAAQSVLPLSGPAFVLADQAYKAYAQGDYRIAADKAREALRLRPDVESLGTLLQRAESAQSALPRAGKSIVAAQRSGRATAGRTSIFRSPAFQAANAGYKAYKSANFDAAVAHASSAVRLAPANLDYRFLLINALSSANRLLEAEQATNQATVRFSRSVELSALGASIAQRRAQAPGAAAFAASERRDLGSAIANARSAIRLAPGDLAYRLLLVQALLQSDMFAEAETAATEAMTLDETDPSPQVLRAYARQKQNRRADASADFTEALALPKLSAAAHRQITLIAVDAALAAQDPQGAMALLEKLPEAADQQAGEDVARRRIASAALATGHSSAQMDMPFANGFAPPGLDCSTIDGPQRCSVFPAGWGDRVEPGFAAAAAAYREFDDGRYLQAAENARSAVQLSPDKSAYRLLLINALYRAGLYPEADKAATAALAADGQDASLTAQRGFIRQRLGQDVLARADFEAALAAPAASDRRPIPVTMKIALLADVGRKAEARQLFKKVLAGGANGDFSGVMDTEVAYLAAKVGEDAQALLAFNRADGSAQLVNTAYQDAAFSALGAGNDAQAIAYFERTVDDVVALKLRMEPQLLFLTRRAVAEVSREGGLIASLSYRTAVSGLGVRPGMATNSLQAGVETYWRPWGYQNGRYVELFARAFQTLYSKNGGATGGDTLQAAAGVRYKPFAEQNLVASFSRVFSVSGRPDDWLAQLGYFAGSGSDLRVDMPSWWTTRTSAELGRYLKASQSYALAELQAGQSYRMGDLSNAGDGRWVLFPHASLAANYDSTAVDKSALGFGPGIAARYWFRESTYAAPRSYIDVSMQYRARLSGAERAKGLFVNTTLSY